MTTERKNIDQSISAASSIKLDSYVKAADPLPNEVRATGLLVEIFPGQRVKAAGKWYLVCRKECAKQEKIRLFREWVLTEIANDNDNDLGPYSDSSR